MPNPPTKLSLQELFNLSADMSVSPNMPRFGVTGVDGTGAYRNLNVTTAGSIVISDEVTSSSTVTSATVTASNSTILASNTSRKMANIYNEGSVTAYVKLGSTATTSSYTIAIASGGYYELPRPVYTGVIDAITASSTATLRITELT